MSQPRSARTSVSSGLAVVRSPYRRRSFRVGGAQRGLLHLIRVDRRQRLVVLLARPNAHHPLDRLDEDLTVTDFAGARRSENGADARLDARLGKNPLEFDL